MSEENLKTVSSTVDQNLRDLTIRHTLQPRQAKIPIDINSLNRTRSKSTVQAPPPIIIPPAISEEGDVDDGTGDPGPRKASFTKNPVSRHNSMAGVKARIIELKAYDNGAYKSDEMTNFQRGYIDSSRSSTHESVNSLQLQVQREQYCCFSRWSVFERRLATSVAILAGVILGLVVAVGLLANREDGINPSFVWKP